MIASSNLHARRYEQRFIELRSGRAAACHQSDARLSDIASRLHLAGIRARFHYRSDPLVLARKAGKSGSMMSRKRSRDGCVVIHRPSAGS